MWGINVLTDFTDKNKRIVPKNIKILSDYYGATENAGVENAIRAKMQGWKMHE